MASVYELDQSLDKFFELLEDGEITDDVLLDVWNNLEDDIKSKFENCCKWMVNVKATIDAIKEQKKILNEKQKVLENKIERVKSLMLKVQQKTGEKKLECGTFTTTIQKNPPKLILDVDSVYDVPEEFLKYAEPEVKSKEALDAIKGGASFEWCHSVQEDSLRIR